MSRERIERALREVKVGDIVLLNSTGPLGALVRALSRSYWAHVALVFDCVPRGDGSQDVLLIEADDLCVRVHRIEKYLDAYGPSRIGIKRMPDLDDGERERIRGFFLDAVDTPYDYGRLFAFAVGTAYARAFKTAFPRGTMQRFIDTKKYVCSTFIQRAYFLAVAPEKRRSALFQPERPDMLYQLEYLTPGDIAHSRNTDWLYHPRPTV